MKHSKIIVLLILFVSCVTATVILSFSILTELHKSVISRGIAEDRTVAEKKGDAQLKTRIDILNTAGLNKGSLGSSKIDVCYVGTRSLGFVTTGWYQDCYIRYVDGFSTDAFTEEIREKINAIDGSMLEFWGYTSLPADIDCYVYDKDLIPDMVFIAKNDSNKRIDCKIPDTLSGDGAEDKVGIQVSELAVKTYRTFEKNNIMRNSNQIWIVHEERYVHDELGCAGIFSLSCENPRPVPISADSY